MSRTRAATVSPGRWAAYNILSRVEKDQAFTSILLPLYEADLKAEDRGLCHELTLGVLRNGLFLDKIIEHFTGKKLDKLDLPVLLALRMGLYQMRFMTRIPARAAINESVEIVKQERLVSAASFVNAVLRRAAKETSFDPTESISDELEKLSVAASHPRWLLQKWIDEFGFEETGKLALANNQIPRTSFRLNRLGDGSTLGELEASGAEFAGSKLVPNCFIATKPNKTLYEFAEQGKIVLQDEASQLVAHLVELGNGESFLDVCAAPGNKTTQIINGQIINGQIINEARERGALAGEGFYAAGDLHPRRIETLRRNLERAGIRNVKVFEYDAVQGLPFEAETFDCILVDAPCTGTGTIRHNPEIRWSLKPDDFSELAHKQERILTNAAKALKKGGRIIYSTCSLEKEENEDVVESFLNEHSEFKNVGTGIAGELITERNYLRTFPHRNNTDGFFAAVLKKN